MHVEIKMSALQIHTVTLLMKVTNKHLMPWGTVNLVFLESKINIALDFVFGNIEIQGKQISLFSKGPVIKLFVL